jgi:hypothetical protein
MGRGTAAASGARLKPDVGRQSKGSHESDMMTTRKVDIAAIPHA